MPNSTPAIPEELFHAVAALIPRLIFIAEKECGIDPISLLTLWHIRHFGQLYTGDQTVMLRQELTRMLTKKFRFAASDVSKLLSELHDSGFITRTSLSRSERLKLFGGEHGDTRVVILTLPGKQKIDDFKHNIRTRGERWISQQPGRTRLTIRAFLPVAVSFARWLVKRYEPDRESILYGASTTTE